MKKNIDEHRQCAALPFRKKDDGSIEIMLITSRETGRWVIPKGWVEPGVDAKDAAEREAYEEAGLVGKTSRCSIGAYGYRKGLSDGRSSDCVVDVFSMEVSDQLATWPEQSQRLTQWFSVTDAAIAVEEQELQAIISRIAATPTK